MSTHDMNIANQSFPNFRTDLNNALGALVTNSSSTTEPATTFSHQWWVDTSSSPSVVKIRNEANDAWVTIGTIDESGDTFTLTANATIPTLSVTGNTTLGDASGDAVTINASTVSTPNGLNFDSNTFVIDAANNNVGIGTSSTQRKLHVVGQIGSYHTANDSQILMYNNGTVGSINCTYGSTGSYLPLTFLTGDSERMRIDSSGNVGVGTSSPAVKFQSTIASSGVSGIASTAAGLFENSGNADVVIAAGTSSKSRIAFGDSGDWIAGRIDYDHSDNSLRFGTNATAERMLIDSSGNVGVGTSSPSTKLHVNNGFLQIDQGGTHAVRLGSTDQIVGGADNEGIIQTNTNKGLRFFAGAAERMRIDNSGNLLVGTTSADAKIHVQNSTNSIGAYFDSAAHNTSGDGGVRTRIGGNCNNTSSNHFRGTTDGVNNWYLYGNGTTSYSSDERLKKNIETTRDGYLNDLMALRVVKYNWYTDEDSTPKELGLIAQEVEEVFPGLVQEHDLEGVGMRKNIKHSVMEFILIKAIQELKVENDALKSRLDAAGL